MAKQPGNYNTEVPVPATESFPMDSSNLSGSTTVSVPHNGPVTPSPVSIDLLGTNASATVQEYEDTSTTPQTLGDLVSVQSVNGDDSGNAGR